MVSRTLVALTIMSFTLLSCQRQAEKLVEISGHIFVFNYRNATAHYLVTLRKVAPIPDKAVVTAEFENPQGGDALITKERVFAAWDTISLQSPNVHCIKKERQYKVNIRLTSDAGELLQTLQTSFASDLDQSVLPGKPLVVGPFNDKNPEVFYGDGSTDFQNRDVCPRPVCVQGTSSACT